MDHHRGPSPRELAAVIAAVRGETCALLAGLTEGELSLPALPGWTVADVLWHLATSDREAVTAKLLRHLLPGRAPTELEAANDDLVAAARGRDREELARDLERYGRRFTALIGAVPGPVARRTVPSAFGSVPLLWLGTLRLYDEWVHQADIAAALGRPEPEILPEARPILAWFQRRALPADTLPRLTHGDGVVGLEVTDAPGPTWRIDLGTRRFGAHVEAAPSVEVALSTATWCLLAADRHSWEQLHADGRIELRGDDLAAAAALLAAIRVV